MKRIKNEQGFTLIEMLLVLFIVMCLTGIVTKISLKVAEAKEIERFFAQLQLDIQYIQMSSMLLQGDVSMRFESPTNRYLIRKDMNTIYYERPFPKNVEFVPGRSTFVILRYNANGNVSRAGTLLFYTPQGEKKVIITLGAGRVRVE